MDFIGFILVASIGYLAIDFRPPLFLQLGIEVAPNDSFA